MCETLSAKLCGEAEIYRPEPLVFYIIIVLSNTIRNFMKETTTQNVNEFLENAKSKCQRVCEKLNKTLLDRKDEFNRLETMINKLNASHEDSSVFLGYTKCYGLES